MILQFKFLNFCQIAIFLQNALSFIQQVSVVWKAEKIDWYSENWNMSHIST